MIFAHLNSNWILNMKRSRQVNNIWILEIIKLQSTRTNEVPQGNFPSSKIKEMVNSYLDNVRGGNLSANWL